MRVSRRACIKRLRTVEEAIRVKRSVLSAYVVTDITRATVVTFFIVLTCIRCEAPDDYIFNETTGLGYKLVYQPQTWAVSKQRCEDEGATLAVPKSLEEFTFMQKLVRAMHLPNITDSEFKLLAWLGINNLEDHRIWRNIYGENIDETGFNKWAHGNGVGYSDAPAEPHCVGIDAVNLLRDFWCHRRQPFICQIKLKSN